MTTTTRPVAPAPAPARTGSAATAARLTGLAVLAAVLVGVCFVSITLGTRGVGLSTILRSFTDYDPDSTAQTVIRELRVPRTIVGILAGMALGLGGALLQGVTRNPLADPSIMGTTNGASAAIVITIMVFGAQSLHTYVWFGFLGAALATFVVYGVASFGREGATPVKLALAGAAVSAGLYSVITGIVMTNLDALNEMRVWQVGSLASRGWPILHQVWPFFLVGILVALGTARWLNGLALGDDLATSLGQDVRRTRAFVFVVVTVLAGSAVAACGPIVFVGLVVPHLARAICGPDYRWTLPYTLLLSPILLLTADIIGRLVMRPSELQVGVVLGVVGAPAFIALVRRRNLAEL